MNEYVKLGQMFDKPDMERIGIFAEMPYTHGRGYQPISASLEYIKGKNMMGPGPKSKAGTSDCYFEKEFKRVFEGEAIRGRGRKIVPRKFKPVSKFPFLPIGETKWHSTPGDFYGTFNTASYFSGKSHPTKYQSEGKNFLTRPSKKGGCGYADIGIGKYPEHPAYRYGAKANYKQYGKVLNGPMITSNHPIEFFETNPYKLPSNIPIGKTYVQPKDKSPPFLKPGIIKPAGPGKRLAGCKAGGFSKYPPHPDDKFFTVWDLEQPKRLVGKRWDPQAGGDKTMYTSSIISHNIRFKMNKRTIHKFEPTYIKYLMD